MSEHIVVSSWLGSDDTFLTLGIFCQSISPRIGDDRGKFLVKKIVLRQLHAQSHPWMSELRKMHLDLLILL